MRFSLQVLVCGLLCSLSEVISPAFILKASRLRRKDPLLNDIINIVVEEVFGSVNSGMSKSDFAP